MSQVRYLTTEDAAVIVGVKGNTLRRAIHRGEIRWINIGTPERPRVRISEADLHAWMDSRASSPAARRSRAS